MLALGASSAELQRRQLAFEAIRKSLASQQLETEARTMNGAPSRSGSITIRTLVVVLMVTNGVLGFMVVTLNGEVSRLGERR